MRASSSLGRNFAAGATAVLAFLILSTGIAFADVDQSDFDRLKDILKSTTIALRAAQDENAALTANQGAMTAQVAALKQQLADDEAKLGGTDGMKTKLDAAQSAAQSAQSEASQARELIGKWQDAYKQAADAARTRDAAAKDATQSLRQTTTSLKRCQQRNTKLVSIADEILDKLQNQSVAECLARDDKVTGIYRVQLENMAQDYGDKIQDQQIAPKPQ